MSWSVVPGDVVRMKSFKDRRILVDGGDLTLSFKSDKGTEAVFLLLGSEPIDGSKPLDVEKRLNELGWFFKEEEDDNEVNTATTPEDKPVSGG